MSTSISGAWEIRPSCSTSVPGFPKGSRVLANILTSVPRINVALGLPPQGSEMDLVLWWRSYMKAAPSFEPREVNGGPLLDNVLEGEAVDLAQDSDAGLARARRRPVHRNRLHGDHEGPEFRLGQQRLLPHPDPGPRRRHHHDVARQARPHHHDQVPRARISPAPWPSLSACIRHCSCSPGWRSRTARANTKRPAGILGEPLEVINMPRTGLPVPANAEIAFEGLIHPGDADPGRPARRVDWLLRRRQPARTGHSHLHHDASKRSDPARRHPGRAAQR